MHRQLAKLSISRMLTLLWMLLCQVPANSLTFACGYTDGSLEYIDFSTISAMRSAKRKCASATKSLLINETILNLIGKEVTDDIISWVFDRDLEMCVNIENTSLTDVHLSADSMTKTCEGPMISFINNYDMRFFSLTKDLMQILISVPNSLRIRGNQNIDEAVFEMLKRAEGSERGIWDLQVLGECALPKPFLSFDTLDRTCSKYYGTLTLEQGVTEILYDTAKVHTFEIESCIQIEKTDLKDVTFLMAFSRFKPIPFCLQYIRNNRRLCQKNLNYLNEYFENIEFFNNSNQACGECMGGRVSEHYLRESENCSFIYGDLLITDLRGLPQNICNLRTIETIQGRLIISNNTGLERFMPFVSLKNVGLKNGSDIAITIKDNADLKAVLMPKLIDVSLNKGDRRVEIVNNPMFIENSDEKKITMNSLEKQEAANHAVSALDDVLTQNFGLLCSIIAAAFVFVLLSIRGSLTIVQRQKRTSSLPEVPYNLSSRSQEQLTNLCTEILAKNPMVWCVEDLILVCKKNRTTTARNTRYSSRKGRYFESCMIPVMANGKIVHKNYAPIQARVEAMLNFDLVVMVGSTPTVSSVVPHLPENVGDFSAYGDSIAYELLEVSQVSSSTTRFGYKTKNERKHTVKKIELLLFQWFPEQLPTEFSQLLQLVAFARGRKAACTSDRRKEVFSLIYFFYANVVDAKEPKSVVEIFQLHSKLCNGAPLDCREILYVMRILLEWAKAANCIPSKIEKSCTDWCRIYDQMATFSKKHMNIVNVHPLHLTRLDCLSTLIDEVVNARKQTLNFSERPFEVMKDRFRRKTFEEIQREMLETTKTINEEFKETTTDTVDRNKNTSLSHSKEQASE